MNFLMLIGIAMSVTFFAFIADPLYKNLGLKNTSRLIGCVLFAVAWVIISAYLIYQP